LSVTVVLAGRVAGEE